MDQKRLLLAIAISLAILLGFQFLLKPYLPHPPEAPRDAKRIEATPPEGGPGEGARPISSAQQAAVPKEVPRVPIAAPRVRGSISLLGARIDDLVLVDYRETLAKDSPLVRLLEPRSDPKPYYAQYGWSSPDRNVRVPDSDTVWTSSGGTLGPASPVTLTWNNGTGLTFELLFTIDDNYMFGVDQRVRNETGAPVDVVPWARIRRDYKPEIAGYYILFEGLLGVANGTLQETSYDKAQSEGDKRNGVAFEASGDGGWAGITDKYWLTALVPDQTTASTLSFRHVSVPVAGGPAQNRYQVDYAARDAQSVAPGGQSSLVSHLFAGAKVVGLLDQYEKQYHIPYFDKAVDFGWFYWLTKPIFYALDYLNDLLGNFGLAIMAFTVFVKLLFFPLANYSYRSMGRMKLLAPKMQSLREKYKEEPQKLQAEMMALYKAEKINPASGCLPMLVQIPVFFSLYKVIFITIEMRQAPFFGWIHDLSQVDPTNVFNLFGLIPFNPAAYIPFLHFGAWPLIMGVTMFLQQKLNPPPPDPVQAKLFQFMPIIFTFMLANFPAGLVIYWSWNNTLSIIQQWFIQRRARLPQPNLART